MAVKSGSKWQKKHPIEFADFPTGNNLRGLSAYFALKAKLSEVLI